MGINEYLFEKRYKDGFKEGIRLGRELKRAKTIEEKLEIARTLKNLGITIATIAKGTGLSIAEIKAL